MAFLMLELFYYQEKDTKSVFKKKVQKHIEVKFSGH